MTILFYKKIFNRNYSIYDRLRVGDIAEHLPSGINVEFSNDPHQRQLADVVIWDVPFLFNEMVLVNKPAGQIWVGWCLESNHTYPWLKNALAICDFSMTYSLSSDIPIPYFTYAMRDELLTAEVKPKTNDMVSWIGSSVNKSSRRELLDALCNVLNVDCYGYRRNAIVADRSYQTKQIVSSDYKFVLAFENSIWADFITEKIYDPLLCGSVPIYLGAHNIEEFVPADNCYINANGKSVAELVDEIEAYLNDRALYDSLFEWKHKPLRQSFLDKTDLVKDHFISRLISVL